MSGIRRDHGDIGRGALAARQERLNRTAGGFGLGFPARAPVSVDVAQDNAASHIQNAGDFAQGNGLDLDLDVSGGFGRGWWGPIGGAGPVDVEVSQSNSAFDIQNFGDFSQFNQAQLDIDVGGYFPWAAI